MPIESATYISDLNASNPIGATDHVATADDHLRLIKSAIKATFPNVAGAVAADHTELSLLDGITGFSGTGSVLAKTAGPTFTGTVTGGTFAGSGASLTALNASNLASGTVPDGRFPATLPAASAANLTAIPAANVTGSHALPDGVLSTNVPLKNATNVFSGSCSFTQGGNNFIVLDSTAGQPYLAFQVNSVTKAFVALSDASGGASAGDIVIRAESGGATFSGNGGGSAYLRLSNAGLVTTPNASAAEVGYKGVPITAKTADYTIAAADAGTCLSCSSAADDITVQASGAPPDGTIVMVVNATTGAIHIRQGSGATLYLQGTATTGDRTVAQSGVAFIYFHSISAVLVSGSGVS